MSQSQRTFALALLAGLTLCTFSACSDDIEVKEHCVAGTAWDHDYNVLVSGLLQLQAEPFAEISREAFFAQVDELCAALPGLTDHQVKLEMARIVALIRDGHTVLFVGTGSPTVTIFPMRAAWFSDGLHVTGAHQSLSEIVGTRIVSIEGRPPQELQEELRPYITHANDQLLQRASRDFLLLPQILHAMGFSGSPDEAIFRFERPDGSQFDQLVTDSRPSHPNEREVFLAPQPYADHSQWLPSLDVPRAALPLYARNPDAHYWMEWLPQPEALYVQQNRARNASAQSFDDFWDDVLAALDENNAQRLVLDLRFNSGGDLNIAKDEMRSLSGHRLDRRGGIFVLTGPKTFSAAIANTTHILDATAAIQVGEEPGDILDSYNNTDSFFLPDSGIEISYGEEHQLYPDRLRERLIPELPAPMSFADYSAGRDPALEAALSFRGSPLSRTSTQRF